MVVVVDLGSRARSRPVGLVNNTSSSTGVLGGRRGAAGWDESRRHSRQHHDWSEDSLEIHGRRNSQLHAASEVGRGMAGACPGERAMTWVPPPTTPSSQPARRTAQPHFSGAARSKQKKKSSACQCCSEPKYMRETHASLVKHADPVPTSASMRRNRISSNATFDLHIHVVRTARRGGQWRPDQAFQVPPLPSPTLQQRIFDTLRVGRPIQPLGNELRRQVGIQ